MNLYDQEMQIIGGICMRKRITRRKLLESELRIKAYLYRSWGSSAFFNIKLSKLSLQNYYTFLLREKHYEVEVCDECKQELLVVSIPIGIIKEIKRQERIARNRRSNRAYRAYYHNKSYVTDAFYDSERIYHANQDRKDFGPNPYFDQIHLEDF